MKTEFPTSLLQHSRSKRKKLLNSRIFARLKGNFWGALKKPTLFSTFIMFGLSLITLIIGLAAPNFFKQSFAINEYGIILSVHTGISTIIFALILFTVEGTRSSTNRDKGRVLLYESHIYALVCFTIFSFILFIFEAPVTTAILNVFLISLGSILSLSTLINLNLNRTAFNKKKALLFKERLKSGTEWTILNKLKENELFRFFKNEKMYLNFSLWTPKIDSKSVYINSRRNCIVEDLNIDLIQQISEKINYYARENGYVFYEEGIPKSGQWEFRSPLQDLPKEFRPPKLNDFRYWYAYIGKELKEGAPLLSFHSELNVPENIISEIKILANRAIVKTNANDVDPSEELQVEIEEIEETAKKAVLSNSKVEVKESLLLIETLASSFIESLDDYNSNFNYSESKQQRNNFFSSNWIELTWLENLLNKLFQAIDKKNVDSDISLIINHSPFKIAENSIKKNNHIVFHEMMSVWRLDFQIKASSYNDNEASIKRSLKLFTNFIKYSLSSLFQNEETNLIGTKDQYSDFSKHILYVASIVVRLCYDRDDCILQKEMKDLIKSTFGEHKNHPYSSNKPDDNVYDKTESLTSLKYQFYFGMNAWIKTLNRETNEHKSFARFIEKNLPSNFYSKINLFTSFSTDGIDSFWGFDHWGMVADGQVRSVLPHENNQNYFFTLLSCGLTSENCQPKSTDIKNLKRLYNFIRPESFINKKMSKLEGEQKELFNRFFNAVDTLEKERVESSILNFKTSSNKINEFINKFSDDFLKSSTLRRLFSKWNKIKSVEEMSESIKRLGINQIEDKQVFIDDWPTHYMDVEANFAQTAALIENSFILNQIEKNCTQIEITPSDLIETIKKNTDGSDSIIIANSSLHSTISQISGFKFDKPVGSFSSVCNHVISIGAQNIPIMFLQREFNFEGLFILKQSDLPTLIQYIGPAEGTKDIKETQKKDHFFINISSFDETPDLLDKLIEDSPDWLKEYGSIEEQKDYLLTKCTVKILSFLQIHEASKNKVIKIIVNSQGPSQPKT